MPDREKFDEWCILELMGHRRLYGRVTEQELGGANMLRVDVFNKDPDPIATQFYSSSAVYCITPTTEDICRRMGERTRPEPVTRWELPPAIEGDSADIDAATGTADDEFPI